MRWQMLWGIRRFFVGIHFTEAEAKQLKEWIDMQTEI